MKTLPDPSVAKKLVVKSGEESATSESCQIRRILVPIDFSHMSLKAMPYAVAISRQFSAEVHLLHVVDVTKNLPLGIRSLPRKSQAEWNQRLMKRLTDIALKYKTSSEVYIREPLQGSAYNEICEAARQLKADLIVIASHGFTGYRRTILGSTAERVVQHAPCPVLIVHRHVGSWKTSGNQRIRPGFNLKKILVPMDLSDSSQVAFKYAVKLARHFNAELRLVHVINPHAYPFGDEFALLDAAHLIRKTSQAVRRQMRDVAARTKLPYSVEVGYGSPAAQICNAANQDADIIVMSTHGRTGIGHVLIGSVAERVVRQARCPVLVVRTRSQT